MFKLTYIKPQITSPEDQLKAEKELRWTLELLERNPLVANISVTTWDDVEKMCAQLELDALKGTDLVN